VAAAEAVSMIEGMQATLARLAQPLPERDSVDETTAGLMADAPVAVADPALPPEAAKPAVSTLATVAAVTAPDKAPADAVVTPSKGKVFIKGWAVNLRSYFYRADAERLLRSYQRQGIDAEIREIPKGNATWYRVRVMGFASKGAAESFIEQLTPEQGQEGAWPSYYEGFVGG
jgi:cell division septation protein DedD